MHVLETSGASRVRATFAQFPVIWGWSDRCSFCRRYETPLLELLENGGGGGGNGLGTPAGVRGLRRYRLDLAIALVAFGTTVCVAIAESSRCVAVTSEKLKIVLS